jgi:hypothetical protein
MMTSTGVVPVTQGQIVTHVVSLFWLAESREVSNKDVQIPTWSSGDYQASSSTSGSGETQQLIVHVVALAAVGALISVKRWVRYVYGFVGWAG